MRKQNVGLLFGGMNPEYELSLQSAAAVLRQLSTEKYDIYPVGITRSGRWMLYTGQSADLIATGEWEQAADNCPVAISPVRGQGMLCFRPEGMTAVPLDVVFPLLQGKNGADGAIQGLMQLAGIPCVGAGVETAAVSMDRAASKLAAQRIGLACGDWLEVHAEELHRRMEAVLAQVLSRFAFPVFVKPVGADGAATMATDSISLQAALCRAAEQDQRVLVEAQVRGQAVQVAVMGNGSPIASICGQIDYEAPASEDGQLPAQTPVHIIPAQIDEQVAEQVRDAAVKLYSALDCRGFGRVDFFVTEEGIPVFDKISTTPGFAADSMYRQLFEASGVPFADLLDRLVELAMEVQV